MENLCSSPQTDFLSQLSLSTRENLFTFGKVHIFKKHDLIFQAGSPGDNVYILVKGRAKIYQLSPSGKEVILWFCFPGELFGMAEVCRQGRRQVHARACSDSEIIKISQADFITFLSQHTDAAMLTISILSGRMRSLGEMLLNLTSDDVMSRLLKLLTRLSTQYGKHIGNDLLLDFPITHQEIADMIGASRQTVSSAISDLRKRGLIDIENHRIQLLNPTGLLELSNQLTETIYINS